MLPDEMCEAGDAAAAMVMMDYDGDDEASTQRTQE